MNSDRSFHDGAAGARMVFQDNKGAIIFSACRVLFSCREALEAEIGACMEGLSLSIQRSEPPVVIEMDSMVPVKLIQSQDLDRSIYYATVKEIKHLMSLRRTCITLISHSQNKDYDLAWFRTLSFPRFSSGRL